MAYVPFGIAESSPLKQYLRVSSKRAVIPEECNRAESRRSRLRSLRNAAYRGVVVVLSLSCGLTWGHQVRVDSPKRSWSMPRGTLRAN